MSSAITIVAGVVAAWLMADFISGVVHWWEDRYGVEEWPIVGPLIVTPNVRHHAEPHEFLRGNIVSRNWTTFIPAIAFAAAALWAGSPWLALVGAFVSVANEVHAWAHQKCSRPIRAMQLLGVIQSQEQHSAHHRRPFDRNYCVMTDWANPVLSAVHFWPAAERVVARFGPRPRLERAEA